MERSWTSIGIATLIWALAACETGQPIAPEGTRKPFFMPNHGFAPDSGAEHVDEHVGFRVRWKEGNYTLEWVRAPFEHYYACAARDTTVYTPTRLYDTKFEFNIDLALDMFRIDMQERVGTMGRIDPLPFTLRGGERAVLLGKYKHVTVPISAELDSLTSTGWVRIDQAAEILRYRYLEWEVEYELCEDPDDDDHDQGAG